MKHIHIIILLAILPVLGWARENKGGPVIPRMQPRTSADLCDASSSKVTLDINNVRALLMNGGDMWWDLTGNPRYEIPKADDPANAKHSLFAGSLWIGGLDDSNQLRIAAQTYRQSGNDFWPGPLRLGSADTENDVCAFWDKHFKINRTDIDEFRSGGRRAQIIDEWPGVNKYHPGYEKFLAPFEDVNGDFDYNPDDGDYPKILGDQAIWWVVNDKGNLHTSTNGLAIGVEIQMMAFGFSTANAVNNMTFYSQKVINRSSQTLNKTYIGQWVDADLGYAFDDYVGCDTIRGLGICYNGDPDDNRPQGYGLKPPAIGVDFFQGPLQDADTLDNDFDGIVDNERIGMAKFVYYNNDFSRNGNPEQKEHFYNYLIGKWKDGATMIDNRDGKGNGYPNPGEAIIPANYMFPDYPGERCSFVRYTSGNRWDEKSVGNVPQDRRFIQSAGPFTLKPGAVNEIVVGVVWARDENNLFDVEQVGSYCALLQADDIAQALFDSGFQLLNGPDAPTLAIEEYDQELSLSWNYTKPTSNNYFENYAQKDPILQSLAIDESKKIFDFQGYIVYQLRDDRVSAAELDDPAKARLVAQCDIRDGISTIVNREEINVSGLSQPIIQDKIMVYGEDAGLFHNVKVTQDYFAEGSDSRLVNYRNYYYTVVAYAYNDTSSDGRKFIIGRNFESPTQWRMMATPHKTDFENFGTVLNSAHGDGPDVAKISGLGNGGNFTRLTQLIQEQVIKEPYHVKEPVYASGATPIEIKVVSPKDIMPKKYKVVVTGDKFLDSTKTVTNTGETINTYRYSDWSLLDITGNKVDTIYRSVFVRRTYPDGIPSPSILGGESKVIIQNVTENGKVVERINHGFAIAVKDVSNPGTDNKDLTSGYIGSEIEFEDPLRPWLMGLPDQDNIDLFNWIRSGPICDPERVKDVDPDFRDMGCEAPKHIEYNLVDSLQNFEEVADGMWSPYVLAAHYNVNKDIVGPKMYIWTGANPTFKQVEELDPAKVVSLDKLPNVDIVITKDPSKWSRCVVVETSPSQVLGSGSPILTAKYRKSLSLGEVQSAGTVVGKPASPQEEYGMSFFPGYAINLDTGERLNIFFGESTWHKKENGDDMLFNPTNKLFTTEDPKVVGGRHYVYVTNTKYDECKELAKILRVPPDAQVPVAEGHPCQFFYNAETLQVNLAYEQVAWTSIPLVAIGRDQALFKMYDQIPTGVTVRLRVNRKFTDNPEYVFDMTKFAAQKQVNDVAEASVEMINIVPNPFYARSGVGRGSYEKSQIDARVKLTNLPEKCNIRIFTLNGALVRLYRKDSESPDQEWDLKNDYGVPIASGLYIIHIDAGDLGEKVLKFFAVMPELDVNAY